jgi:hypothetical protein
VYRKIIYWYKIQKMTNNRWPKKVTQELAKGEWTSKWHEELKTAYKELGKYGNIEAAMRGKNWKKEIRRIWHRWECEEWKIARGKKEEMKLYPKNKLLGKRESIGSTKAKKTFTKYRIGDLINEDFKPHRKCPACKVDITEIRTHILLHCNRTREARKEWGHEAQITRDIQRGQTPGQILKRILEDEEANNIRAIHKIHQKWEEATQEGQ